MTIIQEVRQLEVGIELHLDVIVESNLKSTNDYEKKQAKSKIKNNLQNNLQKRPKYRCPKIKNSRKGQ